MSNSALTNPALTMSKWMRDALVAERVKHLPIQNVIYNRVPNPAKGLTENFFANVGVPVKTNFGLLLPTQFFYNDRKGLLMVRASSNELQKIEGALQSLHWGMATVTNWNQVTPLRVN